MHPFPHSTYEAAAQRAAQRTTHPAVLESLVCTTKAQERSREALRSGIAMVTGQQAGLFGGPLYTLHKAAAAIGNARALEAHTGIPCAPVFWLQNEDHDFDEIASVGLLDGDQPTSAAVEGVPEQDGWPVAHRHLGPSISQALSTVEGVLEGSHASEVVAFLRETHSPTQTASEAFRLGIERLFAAHGLVVVDPMVPALREAAKPVHQRAINEAGSLSRCIDEGQVHVRDGWPLSFFHPQGDAGPRYRIEPCDGGFRLCGTSTIVSSDEVLAGSLTTSALLRPILQDTLLPTVAYAGGPGERAYLAQMHALWGAFDLPAPLIVPRARFALVDAKSQRQFRRLGLLLGDLEKSRNELLAQLATAPSDQPAPDDVLAALTKPLAILEELGAHDLDKGMRKALAKTERSMKHSASRFVARYRRSLTLQDDVMTGRLDQLLSRMQPGGAPQERVLGWPSFAAQVGIDALVQRIVDAVVPFDGTLREIQL